MLFKLAVTGQRDNGKEKIKLDYSDKDGRVLSVHFCRVDDKPCVEIFTTRGQSVILSSSQITALIEELRTYLPVRS